MSIQSDLDKIFDYIVEKGLLERVQTTFIITARSSGIRVGQKFVYDLWKCLGEDDIPFSVPDLFHSTEKEVVQKCLNDFWLKVYSYE